MGVTIVATDTEVSIHDFVRDTTKWLKVATEDGLVITKHGVPAYRLKRLEVSSFEKSVRFADKEPTYSCGCKRGLIKHCNKHGVE